MKNEKFPSKIRPTVLICMTTFEGYGSSWDNFLLNPSLKSRFTQEFSRFRRILAGLVGYKFASRK